MFWSRRRWSSAEELLRIEAGRSSPASPIAARTGRRDAETAEPTTAAWTPVLKKSRRCIERPPGSRDSPPDLRQITVGLQGLILASRLRPRKIPPGELEPNATPTKTN